MKKNMYYFNFGLPASSGEGLDTNLRGGANLSKMEHASMKPLPCGSWPV